MHKELVANLKNCFEFFKTESLSRPNQEIVGLLGVQNNKPVALIVKNRSPNPQKCFAVDPLDVFSFQSDKDLIAIFHSHIYGDSQFSSFDVATADNCLMPFVVYSLPENKFNLYIPENSEVSANHLESLKEAVND